MAELIFEDKPFLIASALTFCCVPGIYCLLLKHMMFVCHDKYA